MTKEPFATPEPEPYEHHDAWLRRCAAAFAEWVNQPITLVIADELVRQAADEGRSIQVVVNGPYHMVASLTEKSA